MAGPGILVTLLGVALGMVILGLTIAYVLVPLFKVIGLSIAEAASRLGISESAMKVRVHRGLGAMRKLLETESL